MKKLVLSAALGATIIGGTVAAASVLPAYAQSSGQAQTQAQTQNGDQAQDGQKHRQHRIAKAVIKTASDTIGVQPKDLLGELKNGKSIADVATEHGKNPQDVVNALVAQVNTKVDEAVAAGKIPADRGAEIKTKAPERITKLVNAHRQPGQHGANRGNG